MGFTYHLPWKSCSLLLCVIQGEGADMLAYENHACVPQLHLFLRAELVYKLSLNRLTFVSAFPPPSPPTPRRHKRFGRASTPLLRKKEAMRSRCESWVHGWRSP